MLVGLTSRRVCGFSLLLSRARLQVSALKVELDSKRFISVLPFQLSDSISDRATVHHPRWRANNTNTCTGYMNSCAPCFLSQLLSLALMRSLLSSQKFKVLSSNSTSHPQYVGPLPIFRPPAIPSPDLTSGVRAFVSPPPRILASRAPKL